ncbi:MAG: hypothetical protein GF334_01365 [Candidatus Altiarchaeales archaeon]|nr:hypothetical protein [Candidatus Altiarchaeales archaeon]
MKRYEAVPQRYLTRRVPVVIRLDACHFHTWCRGLEKPFDDRLVECMASATHSLCTKISGCRFAYTQSDEISLLLTDYASIDTEPWFGYRLEKILSVAASICTAQFNHAVRHNFPVELYSKKEYATFDARAFNIPADDVCNYFLWRQRDCERNSLQGLAQSYFSHKALHKKNSSQLQDMLMEEKGVNWNDLPTHLKRGTAFYRTEVAVEASWSEGVTRKSVWVRDSEIPIFSKDRNYIENWVEPEPQLREPSENCKTYTSNDEKIFKPASDS